MHFILAKYGGAQYILRIKHQNYIRSSTTISLFLIKKARGAYFCNTTNKFLLKANPLEQI